MKRHLMRYLIVIAVVLVIFDLHFVNIAHANTDDSMEGMSYKELTIQVMPEYVIPDGWAEDEPIVLQGQHGMYVNEGEEPFEGNFSIQVPLNDPTFTLALVGEVEGEQVVDTEYTVNEEEEKIVWTPNQPVQPGEEYRFVMEYYYAPFGSDEIRSFSYEYEASSDIENLRVLLFEPIEADNIQVSEEATDIMDMMGMGVHSYEYQNFAEGEIFQLDISYEKDSNITTVEAMEQQEPVEQEMNQGAASAGNTSGQLLSNESAIMISVSIIIAGIFIFLGLRNRQKNPNVAPVRNSKDVKKDKNTKQEDFEAENKKLRKQYIDGQIDEETYRKKLSKIS